MQSVVDIIPSDMVREWFTIQGNVTPEALDKMEKAQRKTGIRRQIIEGLKWGRLYGGAAGLILIRGHEDSWSEPLDLESIMPDAFKGLWILDRWSGITPESEIVDVVGDPDFGLPKYYSISQDGKMIAKVHHSRVVRFTGRELPYLEKMAELYWGESEIEPIYDDIVLYDSVMHNMGNLTFRANVSTMEVENLDQLFSLASTERQKRFWDVMQAQSIAESNFGLRLVNKGDQISTQQYSFSGFNYVVEAVQLNLCAKTHIPMTKLFGRAPAGLSATGEGDIKNYYDIIDGERETKLRPIIERLLPIMCMSTWGQVPDDLSFTFPPLWTPNAIELAQIAQIKSGTILAAYQAGMLNLGPAQKELKKLTEDTGLFDSISDEEIEKNMETTFAEASQMNDPMAGLFGTMGQEKPDEGVPTDEEEKVAETGKQGLE